LILSDADILKEIELGNIICTPFDRRNVSNSSIDLRLGQYIVEQKQPFHTVKFETDDSGKLTVLDPINPKVTNLLNPKIRGAHKFVIKPGQFILAQTLEVVGHPSDRIVSQILDKSSLARLGLSICFSAGFIDAGNVLSVTLEIKNHSKNAIELQYGQHCCQIRFQYLNSPCTKKYNGKYLNCISLQSAK
jgi:deoxycytidine triphosphate deaminase